MAYAAVVSLAQILKQLLSSDDPILRNSKPLIESLHARLSSLKLSLEKLFPAPKSSWSTTDDLEAKIRDTIYKAQDAIEYLIQPRPDVTARSLIFLRETIADIVSIMKTADEIQVSIEEAAERRDLLSEKARPDTKISDDELVGQEEYLEMLKGMLLQDVAMCLVLPIVGMAGIGKTTLAKRIYNNPLVLEHFDARAWVTISPEHRIGCCVESLHQRAAGGASEIFRDEVSYDFPLNLFKGMFESLFMKKYLVVIDDMWETRLWSYVAATVTDNDNGSRIILTTTNAELATYTHSSRNMLRDPFLNDDASWELLCRVVFDQKLSCPSPQLEIIGRKIAKNCEGHPLAIIEVGKLLRGTEKTVANWKAVEEDENPLIIGANDDTPLSRALTSSYKRLPPYLKACFLYMGLLRRNTEIHTSKLIKLWLSEGFVERAECTLSLEIKAKMCLDELITKSLVIVRKDSSSGQAKTCGMHFVFRGLCISEARREDFFHIIKKLNDVGINRRRQQQQQRICFHNNIVLGFKQVHESMDSISSVRSLFFFGPHHQYPIKVYFWPFKLLRVLDSIALRFYMFPSQVFRLVRLRYLAITYDGELPPSISLLFNLEVLVVRRHHHVIKFSVNYLPIEIWNLRKLKHLYCMGSDLVDPSRHNNGLDDDCVFLENLLTLSGVSAHSCVRGVLSRMPKLTNISIRVVQSPTHIETTFSFFGNFTSSLFDDNFESFKCVVVNPSFGVGVVSPSMSPSFSIYLSKLTLSGCGFAWENMKVIAAFPYLVELKVRRYAFRGPVWEVDPESEFLSLEFLLLEDLDVECLNGCFPELVRLTIRHCYKLLYIDPDLMSELWRLDMIEVDDCSPATEMWAREMGDKAKDEGHRLRVHIHSSRDAKNKHN